jgi:hypothetical protein
MYIAWPGLNKQKHVCNAFETIKNNIDYTIYFD